jgi:hypothetical protein
MRNTVTGIVETAAIAIGLAAKKGAATNGVVIAGAGDKCRGIVDAGDFTESVPVGEQATLAVDGLVQAVAGGTVATDDNLESDANGKLIVIAGAGTHERVAIAQEAGVLNDLIKVKVVIDEVII